jgi:CheY-like chemotaxis protein
LNLRLLVEQCQTTAKVVTSTGDLQFWQQGHQQPEERSQEQSHQPSHHPAIAEKFQKLSGERTTQLPQQKNYTIFCIDDSPTALSTIKGFLDAQIFSVVGVTDSLRALMEIFHVKPDLILLDVTMPNLDGFELCSLLRKHANFKNTPVIMVTDKSNLLDRAKAKLVRASGCLSKPFNQSDLLKMIFQHIL